MAFLTESAVRSAAQRVWGSRSGAFEAVTKSAKASRTQTFDIFLSHAFEDAELVAGVKAILEADGLAVYVDWLVDPLLDRSKVTASTADLLRNRMDHSNFLLFMSSSTSPSSRWMPWELGYFDGRSPEHVGILPIVKTAGADFPGQEYLQLYPMYQLIELEQLGRRLARDVDETHAVLLKSDAKR